MPPTIKDRAVKCLHPVPAFKPASEKAVAMQLVPGETLLGVYEPSGAPEPESILITDLGIHWISSEKRQLIEYAQIAGIDSHHNKQELGAQPTLRTLNVELYSGEIIKLPIRGERDHYLDMFDVWRFLNYVLADIERNAERAKATDQAPAARKKRQTA